MLMIIRFIAAHNIRVRIVLKTNKFWLTRNVKKIIIRVSYTEK